MLPIAATIAADAASTALLTPSTLAATTSSGVLGFSANPLRPSWLLALNPIVPPDAVSTPGNSNFFSRIVLSFAALIACSFAVF